MKKIIRESLRHRIACRSTAILLLALFVSAWFHAAAAQQPTKVPPIGYLAGFIVSSRHEAFRQGLRELGYVEGNNIVIEWRDAKGKLDLLPSFAAN